MCVCACAMSCTRTTAYCRARGAPRLSWLMIYNNDLRRRLSPRPFSNDGTLSVWNGFRMLYGFFPPILKSRRITVVPESTERTTDLCIIIETCVGAWISGRAVTVGLPYAVRLARQSRIRMGGCSEHGTALGKRAFLRAVAFKKNIYLYLYIG